MKNYPHKSFPQFSKIVAIKDSPVVNSQLFGKNIQAYKIGDIFEVKSCFHNECVIFHPLVNSTMSVKSENFILLEEWRNTKIDEIIR
jgi:hypothetical protein